MSVLPVRDYRFVLLMRGAGLGAAVSETDPQELGVPPPGREAARRCIIGHRH